MIIKLLAAAGTALVAWSLKRHYGGAGADDLGWILAPTAWLSGIMTGTAFTLQAGEGYLSRERMFVIEKSCAGVNFLIAAFGMLMFALFHRVASPLSAARLLGATLAAAYLAAVIVNTVRIVIAIELAAHPIARSTVSAAEVHRIEGIVVYFGGLMLLYELTQRVDRRVAAGGAA